jgi:hypothetical protein
MAFYGRTPGLTDEYLGTMTNIARASAYGPMPEHGWAYRWRGRVGRAFAEAPQARGQFWDTAAGIPAGLKGYTNPFAASQPAFSTGTISDVSQPLVDAEQMFAGAIYAVGVAARGAQLNHGMSAAPAGQSSTMYARAAADLGPHNPYSHTSTVWGQGAWGIEYMPNAKPAIPAQSGAVGTIHVSDPEFVGAFSDPNQLLPDGRANPKERLKQYRIQLREVGGQALLVNGTYAASGEEAAANAFVFHYGGTLTPDVRYEWRAAVCDQFDAWSDWSSWAEFRIESGAMVSSPRGVAGKVLTMMPNAFTLDYAHVEGLNANRVELELRQGTTPVRSIFAADVTWAPGARVISPNWGQWQPLDWGVDFNWRARVRDTLGLWSDWTTPLPFWTNHRPGVPTNLRPVSGVASSSRPVLSFTMSDPDDQSPQLSAPVRLIDAETDIELWTLPAEHVAGDQWRLPLDADTLPDYGTYRWAARGKDQLLQSAWSTESTVVYAPGPVVAVTAPTDGGIVTSSTFIVWWEADDQVRYRVFIYEDGAAEPVFTSARGTTGRGLQINGGEWIRNGRAYEVAVEVENSATIIGMSPRVRFTVEYPPAPIIVDVQAMAETAAGDRVPSIYRIGWEPSTVAVGRFQRYQLYRMPLGEYEAITGRGLSPVDEAAALMDAAELIHETSSISETTATDDHPPSGVGFAYLVVQEVAEGVESIRSLPAAAIADPLNLTSIVIADKRAGRTRRVVLDILAAAEIAPVRRQAVLETWDHSGVPIVAESPVSYLVLTDAYRLYEREGQTPAQQVAQLQGLRQPRADGSPTLVIYRDDLGRRVEGTITDLKIHRRRLGRFDVEIELTGREV